MSQEHAVQVGDDPPTSPAELGSVLNVRGYLTAAGAAPAVIALTVLGMFLPVMIVPYAYADDYPILRMAATGQADPFWGKSVLDAYAQIGRPFTGLLSTWFFSAAGTIDNLRFVRLVGVLAIVILVLLLHLALVRSGIAPTLAGLIAVLVSSLPAFQVYASWAVCFCFPLAAALAGGASVLAVASIEGPGSLVMDRRMGAGAMLLASLLTYQSAAMFFWVFLAVAVVGARHDSRKALLLTRTHLGVGAIAMAIAFAVTKLAIRYLGSTTVTHRTALTHDVTGKARWFVEQPLYKSLNLFDLTPSRWLAAVVALVAIGGILLWLLRYSPQPLTYLAIGAILIPLSYLPNLVVQDMWPAYRTQVALSSLVALYFCLGAVGSWLVLREWLQPRVNDRALQAAGRAALGAGVVFVGASVFIAARNVTTLIAEPQMTELRMVRSQVAALPDGVARVGFVETPFDWGVSKLVVSDEFGLPTTSVPLFPARMVLVLLHEEGRLPSNETPPTVDLLPWNTSTYPKDEPVIDVRGLRDLR